MSGRIAIGGLVAASAVSVGVVAAAGPITVTIGLCAAGLLVLTLLAIRRGSRAALKTRVKLIDRGQGKQATGLEPVELRAARALFYVGMVTLAEPAFRAGLTISEFAFIGAFVLCVLAVIRGSPVPSVPAPVIVAVGVFLFGAAISSLGAQSPPRSAVQVLHAAYVLLLWPWVGVMVIRTRRQLLTALGLWACSAAIDGIGALAQVAGIHLPGTSASEQGRYEAFTVHPNDLGGAAGLALVPALVFATCATRARSRVWLRWLPLPLIAAALVLSGSISGMAAAVLGLLVWLSSPAIRSSSRVAVVIAALCAVGALSVAGARVTSPAQRLAQITSPGVGSAQDRISDAEAAWQRIKKDPIVGTGLDAPDTGVAIISHGVTTAYQVHGLPIAAWYEAGIFGLAGLLSVIGCFAVIGWRVVPRSRSSDDQLIAWGLLGVFAGFLVEVMTQPMVLQGYDWIIGVLLIAWASVVALERPTSRDTISLSQDIPVPSPVGVAS
jgi:hypothetical protein